MGAKRVRRRRVLPHVFELSLERGRSTKGRSTRGRFKREGGPGEEAGLKVRVLPGRVFQQKETAEEQRRKKGEEESEKTKEKREKKQ